MRAARGRAAEELTLEVAALLLLSIRCGRFEFVLDDAVDGPGLNLSVEAALLEVLRLRDEA